MQVDTFTWLRRSAHKCVHDVKQADLLLPSRSLSRNWILRHSLPVASERRPVLLLANCGLDRSIARVTCLYPREFASKRVLPGRP